MRRIWFFIRKEFLQLGRDWHALLMLFVMPTLFILIMSFALQEGFAGHSKVELEYALNDQSDSPVSRALVENFEGSGLFRQQQVTATTEQLRAQARTDVVKFLLVIEPDFSSKLLAKEPAVSLELAPGTDVPLALLAESHLRQALAGAYLNLSLGPTPEGVDIDGSTQSLSVRTLFGSDPRKSRLPSSVQQNVPAWLLFAMFFVAVPLSTVLVAERTNGTLARLQTMQFPRYQVFLGKLVPFFLINIVQVVLMLLVGVYVVPMFGGERLTLGNSLGGLALIASAASLAAVCYALLVAQIARTNEQATIFCGVCNIIMAAIGGIMVPRFLMPKFMQDLSLASPMSWGLEGFLDILLRGGTVIDVLPESAVLGAFALGMIVLAILISRRRFVG